MNSEEVEKILLERSKILLDNEIVVNMLKGYKIEREQTEVLLLATIYTILKEKVEFRDFGL